MILASLIAQTAEGAGYGSGNVMLETIQYPIIAAIIFFFLAMVTLSYRHVSNRHSHKADAYAREHGTQEPRDKREGH